MFIWFPSGTSEPNIDHGVILESHLTSTGFRSGPGPATGWVKKAQYRLTEVPWYEMSHLGWVINVNARVPHWVCLCYYKPSSKSGSFSKWLSHEHGYHIWRNRSRLTKRVRPSQTQITIPTGKIPNGTISESARPKWDDFQKKKISRMGQPQMGIAPKWE